jgi:hypothetical protein
VSVRLERRLLVTVAAQISALVAAVIMLLGRSAALPAPAFAVLSTGAVRVTMVGVSAANDELEQQT